MADAGRHVRPATSFFIYILLVVRRGEVPKWRAELSRDFGLMGIA